MQEEIKEILEFDFESQGERIEINEYERNILKDYITNLQEENASKDYTIKEFMRANKQLQGEKEQLNSLVNSCQEEIRKLKKLCDKYEEEHNTKFNEWVFNKRENERLINELNTCMIERNNYLSRNEKAIEILNNSILLLPTEYADEVAKLKRNIRNVLQGVDKE